MVQVYDRSTPKIKGGENTAAIDRISAVGLSQGPTGRIVVYLVYRTTAREHRMQWEPEEAIPKESLMHLWSYAGRIYKIQRVTGGNQSTPLSPRDQDPNDPEPRQDRISWSWKLPSDVMSSLWVRRGRGRKWIKGGLDRVAKTRRYAEVDSHPTSVGSRDVEITLEVPAIPTFTEKHPN